jgi:hypothetical protein
MPVFFAWEKAIDGDFEADEAECNAGLCTESWDKSLESRR